VTVYGLWGRTSRDFLTYLGRVLVHDNRAELEFLFPECPIREVPASFRSDMCFPIEQHPGMSNVRFPLQRSDFR
jgi:hypothetical protein